MSMYLQGAHITGGEFRAIHQTIQNDYTRVGIQALNKDISHGAMHDSAERDPPPRCHPGTREKATEDIVRWIDEPDPSSNVLWVNGRAGVGKSALMQKIAELGLIYFGGCFFFRRGTPGRNVKDHLFSTLAYQLVTNVHGMLELVDQAMIRDFSLPKRSAAVQLNQLIIEPIRLLPIPLRPVIIIIDGLDECEDFNSQRDILRLIGQVTLDPNIAIRFIIASRPEHQICEMFNEEPLLSKTRRLVLDDEGYDTAADIERYLREEFEGIHSRNIDIMPEVGNPWPSDNHLKTLVWRASGQFIYAATVIKFIGSDMDFHTSQEKLKIILKRGPMQASAFSELDSLYTQILSLYPDPEVLVHTLGVILALEVLRCSEYFKSPTLINVITGFGEGKLHRVLRALQSVMEIRKEPVFDDANDNEPNGNHIQWVKLSHRSFHDFLTDRTRSKPYVIDTEVFLGLILLRILELTTISIKELKEHGRTSNSLPPMNIWRQFELIFKETYRWKTWTSSFKMELCLALNKLRKVLFTDSDQPPLSGKLSMPFCTTLIPTLHCICSVPYSIRRYSLFYLPRKGDPLQLDHFLAEVRSLLDECYRKTTAGFVNGEISILLHLVLNVREGPFLLNPKFLGEIEAISNNTPNRQRLRKFIHEHSPLIHTHHTRVNDKHLLEYSISPFLCDFVFDPNRSRSLYSASLVTRACQEAFISKDSGFSFSRSRFFVQYDSDEVSDASRLLEHARNGSDNNDLLLFLQYLSEIHWLDIYIRGWGERLLVHAIIHWACTTLESSSLEHGPLRDAMQKVLTAILSRGIFPALDQQISRVNELGIFENQNCLRCWQDGFPETLSLGNVLGILPMCTGQILFQALCTRIVESNLLGRVGDMYRSGDIVLPHTCGDGSTHSEGNSKIHPFPEMRNGYSKYFSDIRVSRCRRNWSFAFTHASTSSKCILFAVRSLVQFNYFVKQRWPHGVEWIVSETIDWLKNQTVDPQPQDELIAWMEDAIKKIEKRIAIQKQEEIDEELERSAEWASVIQRSQTNVV